MVLGSSVHTPARTEVSTSTFLYAETLSIALLRYNAKYVAQTDNF